MGDLKLTAYLVLAELRSIKYALCEVTEKCMIMHNVKGYANTRMFYRLYRALVPTITQYSNQ